MKCFKNHIIANNNFENPWCHDCKSHANPLKVSSIFRSTAGRKLEIGFSETMLIILENLSQDILGCWCSGSSTEKSF